MVAKKTTETFTRKTVGELVPGDRFRELPDPDRELESPLQEVISLEKNESSLLEEDQVTKKEIVVCKTKLENSSGVFFFQAFAKVEVEVLNG
jgi:hypothetical protein